MYEYAREVLDNKLDSMLADDTHFETPLWEKQFDEIISAIELLKAGERK